MVGIGGGSIEGGNNRGVYEFGRPRPITQDELAYAADRAARVRLEDDRMLLHVFPQDFNVDGRAGYRNPRGVTCSRLEANVHILTRRHAGARQPDQRRAPSALRAWKRPCSSRSPRPMPPILPEDRARGVALVDIGLHSTDLVVYDGDAVVLALSLPICGDHFTRDVAFGLEGAYEDAERLKVEYGCAISASPPTTA